MAISDSTWRRHPFIVGQTYKAAESFRGFPEFEFQAEQVYDLQHISYSHYDSSTVFTFQDKNTNAIVSWLWHDDDPEELCSRRFQQCT